MMIVSNPSMARLHPGSWIRALRPSKGISYAIVALLLLGAGAGSGDDPPPTAATEEQIQSLFHATETTLEDGVVRLVYHFQTMNEDLVLDWAPEISKTKSRIRWSRGYEGTFSTVERGIIIADTGRWIHKAIWQQMSLRVEYMSMSAMRSGDLLAATFSDPMVRRTVGSNLGQQCVRVNGTSIAGKGIPVSCPTIAAEQRTTFGCQYKDGVLTSLLGESGKGSDTSSDPKFIKKPGPGRAGLHWSGLIQGFVFKITIEGVLDPEWVTKSLEKNEKK